MAADDFPWRAGGGPVALVMAKPRLVVATRNRHKTEEIRALIGTRWEVTDVNDAPGLPAIEETGTSFLENARLKAVGISRCVDGIVLADDSGLEVDALAGAPGVGSSSFGGLEGDHARNNARLLRELAGVPAAARRGRFRCVMVLARGGEPLAHFEGSVEGHLTDAPRGEGGFGYDPLFVPEGYQETFSELGLEVKNRLSHRARALAQAVAWLERQEGGQFGVGAGTEPARNSVDLP